MSQVISFRLDDTDPNEAQALTVLEQWQAEGFTPRQIITTALLKAEGLDLKQLHDNGTAVLIMELRQALKQAQELTEALRRAPAVAPVAPAPEPQNALKPELKLAIKK